MQTQAYAKHQDKQLWSKAVHVHAKFMWKTAPVPQTARLFLRDLHFGLRNYTFQPLAVSLACCILFIFFRTGIVMLNCSLIKVSFKYILLSSSQAAAFYFFYLVSFMS